MKKRYIIIIGELLTTDNKINSYTMGCVHDKIYDVEPTSEEIEKLLKSFKHNCSIQVQAICSL